MTNIQISYLQLCEWLWYDKNFKKKNINILINKIKVEYNIENKWLKIIQKKLSKEFIVNYNKYWAKSFRIRDHFVQHHKDFINKLFVFNPNENNSCVDRNKQSSDKESTKKILPRGRPMKSDENITGTTKYRRINDIQSSIDEDLLIAAATPLIAKKMRTETETESAPNINSKTEIDDDKKSDTSLAMYVDLQLSKEKYMSLREYNKKLEGSNVFPSYEKIYEAKKRCYPQDISITQSGACIELQSLLNHTTERIFLTFTQEEVNDLIDTTVDFYIKWGMDGASGQQTIKQKKKQENSQLNKKDSEISDESVFIVSIVPLLMKTSEKELWRNERPGSVKYCRPLEFKFTKETKEYTKDLYNYYNKKIQNLRHLKIKIFSKEFKVRYSLKCTMIDGKVCNVLTEQTSSICCNICEASPINFNDIQYVRNLPTKDQYFCFGLHPLHCRIRFLEHIWHVALNLDFKEYTVPKDSFNYVVKLAKKNYLQNLFKDTLGLSIDIVKRGYGTTNDGNTSRRFFEKPELISEITNIDVRLIRRYQVILDVLNCGLDIDIQKFRDYSLETAILYSNLYTWYPMPPSVHKVLIHGWKIIESLGLPIGCLSEEAQEANNKIFKKARLNNSRMCDRVKCNEDVVHYLCISSDPRISTLRTKKDKNKKDLSNEAQSLIKN